MHRAGAAALRMLSVVSVTTALRPPAARAKPCGAGRSTVAVAGQLTRMQNVKRWRGRTGEWRTKEEVATCAAGRRSYVKQGDFFRLSPPDPEDILWSSAENLALVVVASYLLYVPVVSALAFVPPPNAVEGGYFFSLVTIVFGTLTASTISDSTQRLSNLRAAIVDECSLMLPLLERLKIAMLERGGEHAADRERVFVACANQLWLHVTDIISGTREIELELMTSRDFDPLMSIVSALQRANYRYGSDELNFAIAATEDVIRARGYRLQLEGSGIPPLQYATLRVLSGLVVLAYTYLTLDGLERKAMPTLLGFTATASGVVPDPSLGVHVLFAFVVGILVSFNAIATDFNEPFRGAFKIESETVATSLKQLRGSLQKYCDIEGCVVANDAAYLPGDAPEWG